MKEKKNIDRIYQEKFKDFEREPNDELWGKIASRLDEKDKKRPLIIPLWWKIGGVAAVLAIVLASLLFTENQNPATGEPGVVYENPEKSTENEAPENREDESIPENSKIQEGLANQDKSQMNDEAEGSSNNKSSESNRSKTSRITSQQNRGDNTAKKNKTSNSINNKAIAAENSISPKTKNEKEKVAIQPGVISENTSGAVAKTEEIAIDTTKTGPVLDEENILAQVEEEKESEEKNREEKLAEANAKKIRLSTFAAPVFYKNIGSGNELSNQFASNSSSSEVTLSYGVKVAYQISDKLRIRTGISKVDINNSIQDISYSPTAMSTAFENIRPSTDRIEIQSNSPGFAPSGLPTGDMNENSSFSSAMAAPGEINQQFGYIEVPVELEYAVIDRRFGLNIIGGGSSLFLDNNRVDLVSGDTKTNLGEASNINSTSFSTNIGLGMDYELTDQFSISVEPIFKYQLNTFNNVNNVQPINFGIYSGLNFRF